MFGRIFNSWHIRPDIYQESHTDRANEPLRWGWVFFERAQILSGIQFTRHFIESVVVETKPFASSNVNVILTWQTCGQRSSMSAGSKRRALAFYFCVQICYMFPILKCRRESDLGLCTTSVLVNGMPPRICKFRQILRPNTSFNRMSPPCSGIHFCRHVYVCICVGLLTYLVKPLTEELLISEIATIRVSDVVLVHWTTLNTKNSSLVSKHSSNRDCLSTISSARRRSREAFQRRGRGVEWNVTQPLRRASFFFESWHMNEASHTFEWVMARKWGVRHMWISRVKGMRHVTHSSESCHEWGASHEFKMCIWVSLNESCVGMRHGAHINGSRTLYVNQPRTPLKEMSQNESCRVSNVSCRTYECVTNSI